jgi:cell division transport system permease protein
LFATFLCFGLTLALAQNLDRLITRWIGGAELTVYIKEGIPEADVDRLVTALSKTPEVSRVERIGEDRAREIFAGEMGDFGDMVRSLPKSAFPESVEIHMNSAFVRNTETRKNLAARVSALSMVDKVDLYDDWFSKLSALAEAGRAASWGLGLSALIVAVLVISSVVRTGVSARAREIEVLGFVGATERYIRFPFLLEGALEAALAMVLAVICLEAIVSRAQAALAEVMPLIGMNALAGFGIKVTVLLILGSAVAGVMGSRLSLKGAAQRG